MSEKAIEFAEYMAKDADALIDAINTHAVMCGADGLAHSPNDIVDSELAVAEHITSLQSSIYEFRKRSEKC